jgi:peptide/nickel transport system permease protein
VLRFIAKRLGFAILVVFCVELAVFIILHAFGDPARLMLPFTATSDQVQQFSHQMGFDQPFTSQFLSLLRGAVHGDFGQSYWQQQPAMALVLERLPATLSLVGIAMAIAIATAVPLGILAAVRRDSIFDKMAVTVSLLGVSMPAFWLGELFIILFAVKLGLFPTSGLDGPSSYVLPALTLAALPMGRLTQIIRSAMLDQLGQQYMLVGRASGLKTSNRIYRHALKNASIPIVTMMGWEFGRLLAGFTVLVEFVFNWPGVGLLAIQAINHHDIPLIEAVVTVVALLIVTLNFALDVIYSILDPRIRMTSKSSRSTTRKSASPAVVGAES